MDTLRSLKSRWKSPSGEVLPVPEQVPAGEPVAATEPVAANQAGLPDNVVPPSAAAPPAEASQQNQPAPPRADLGSPGLPAEPAKSFIGLAWIGGIPAWFVSLAVHLTLMLGMAFLSQESPNDQTQVAITGVPSDPYQIDEAEDEVLEEPMDLPAKAFVPSDDETLQYGANSEGGDGVALQTAPDTTSTASQLAGDDLRESEIGVIAAPRATVLPRAQKLNRNLLVRGAPGGVGTTGAAGAVDRITHEILLSLEERKTLVVWLFDRSISMDMQRKEVNERLDRVYRELGVIQAQGSPAFAKYDDKPLLTAVMSFGRDVEIVTKTPTDDIGQIQQAIAGIKADASGMENIFTAVESAVQQFRWFRLKEPRRNVMLVAFSDEVGNDQQKLDSTVMLCRNLEIPVYVVGVPAPFGRRETFIKYIDPDPNFDQTPQWAPLDQGPESVLPEMVYLRSPGGVPEEPMDSGYGPYALTRLCFETGGTYFAVHPNRNERREVTRYETAPLSAFLTRFFDPDVMRKYRPDYVSMKEYQRLVNENKARLALVTAAQLPSVGQLASPRLVFPRIDEPQLVTSLTQAQQAAAVLEPRISAVYEALKVGEKDRERLTGPRWQAGFDLAMGRVLAAKVRTESYNLMLAAAKQGMKFKNQNSDTWVLTPSENISVGSALEKQSAQARMYLNRVVTDHPDTPWALMASQELEGKFGWEWKEDFQNVNPPRVNRPNNNNNNNNRPPPNDRARMLPKPPPRRAPPAL